MRKKHLFLAIAFTALSTFSWAQLNIIMPDSNKILNNDTVIINGSSAPAAEINVNFYVIDTSDISPINVDARRDSILLPIADTDNSFCWGGACWATNVDVSEGYETIGIHDTSNTISAPEFNGHYFPYGHSGIAYIRYSFYNDNVPTDSSWVMVGYSATPTGIKDISGRDISFSAPYPNPANNSVNFNYTLTNGVQAANLKIFNMLGECVQTLPLNASKNKTIVNVQAMPSGIYICEVQASGYQPAYQKLVVSH